MINLNIIKLIFIILILSTFYFLFFKKGDIKHNILEDKVLHLTNTFEKCYSPDLLPKSNEGIKFTMSFWIYINNIPENALWNSEFSKSKGIIAHNNSPNVYYNPKNGILTIAIGYKDDSGNIEKYLFNLDNLKLQRWENITIVVENRFVDVYLNGVLEKSTKLPNIHFISNRLLYIGQPNNNFNGYIGQVEHFNNALNSDVIKELYKKNSELSIFKQKLDTY
jgi:hypothetical protein